jgi:hypothetical protein
MILVKKVGKKDSLKKCKKAKLKMLQARFDHDHIIRGFAIKANGTRNFKAI